MDYLARDYILVDSISGHIAIWKGAPMRFHSLCCSAIVLVLLSNFAVAAVIEPTAAIDGISQADHSARWWQWAISYPSGSNPIEDSTGEFAQLGDQGGVFYLAGAFSSTPVVRSATVESDQILFFPLTAVSSSIPFFGSNEAEIRADASDDIGVVSDLSVSLNGLAVALPPSAGSLSDFRQLSPLFDFTLPIDNVFGGPPGTYSSVSDGFWVALEELTPGEHQLRFTSRSEGIGQYAGDILLQDITYNLTVVPEPVGSRLQFTGVILGLIGIYRWRRPGYHSV